MKTKRKMKYKKIIIGKYLIEQLENYTVQVCNMCTGQICAWWEETRDFSDDELYYFYEFYMIRQLNYNEVVR